MVHQEQVTLRPNEEQSELRPAVSERETSTSSTDGDEDDGSREELFVGFDAQGGERKGGEEVVALPIINLTAW